MSRTNRWRRRTVMQAIGASVVGTYVGSVATAQSDSASVAFNDQESDGDSVVIESLEIPVDGELLILSGDTVFLERKLNAGTSYTDRTVELSDPIEESTLLRAQLQEPGEYLTDEQALVAVGESLSSAKSSFSIPSGDVEIIDPDPSAGFRLPYALYKPETPADTAPLFVEPLNGPETATEAELRDQLRDAIAGGTFSQAHELGLPGIVPGLPHLPRPGNDEAQSLELPSINFDRRLDDVATDDFPAESLRRVDRQVVRMIQDAKDRLSEDGYSVAPTIHMRGYSSSAQFASRFAFLYPSLVNTITIGGNGAYPLPKASHEGTDLPYPLGTADYEEITGREFDRDRWAQIEQYIYVGREDQPQPDEERDYYSISHAHEEKAVEVFGQNRVTERFPTTKSEYVNVGADATFRIYDGIGHEITDETLEDTKATHEESLDTASDWSTPTNLLPPFDSTEPTGVSVTVDDQESDGESVVIESLQTDRDARLRIVSDKKTDEGFNIGYADIELSAGETFSDRTIQLNEQQIAETRVIRAEIYTDGPALVRDSATITLVNGNDGDTGDGSESGGGSSLPTAPGEPAFGDVLEVIQAFNTNSAYADTGVTPGFRDVLEVIQAFNAG